MSASVATSAVDIVALRRQAVVRQDIAFQIALWNAHYANTEQKMPRSLSTIARKLAELRAAAEKADRRRIAAEAELDALREELARDGTPGRNRVAVLETVCAKHGVRLTELKGSSRKVRFVAARHEAMALLSEDGLSTTQIGRLLGHRDHTTVIHGIAAHKKRVGALA